MDILRDRFSTIISSDVCASCRGGSSGSFYSLDVQWFLSQYYCFRGKFYIGKDFFDMVRNTATFPIIDPEYADTNATAAKADGEDEDDMPLAATTKDERCHREWVGARCRGAVVSSFVIATGGWGGGGGGPSNRTNNHHSLPTPSGGYFCVGWVDPSNIHATRGQRLRHRGGVYTKEGQMSKGITMFKLVLSLAPILPKPMPYNLSRIHHSQMLSLPTTNKLWKIETFQAFQI